MFSDPQFWVAVAFVAFIAVIFNPVRKILTTNLDSQIKDIKDKIEEAENLKNETQGTLSEVKKRQNTAYRECLSPEAPTAGHWRGRKNSLHTRDILHLCLAHHDDHDHHGHLP